MDNMDIRKNRYRMEAEYLSPYATLSSKSMGRQKEEAEDAFRTPFIRDRDRIIHCKSFRRLITKTQVFLLAEGDHYRTRLTHTLEVSQVARSIARSLCLNEDLVEAIALGHDLGHSAFGHSGERVLARLTDGYFQHNRQSRRVVELLENDGKGLNLTLEVRDGIENHRLSLTPMTLEGRVVAYSDRIAYINHDIDDAVRAGVITPDMLPESALRLGKTGSERLGAFIEDMIINSYNKPVIGLSDEISKTLTELYHFMFDRVYCDKQAKLHEQEAEGIIEYLFNAYYNNPLLMPKAYTDLLSRDEPITAVVCDCIAGMTDDYAIKTYKKIKKTAK